MWHFLPNCFTVGSEHSQSDDELSSGHAALGACSCETHPSKAWMVKLHPNYSNMAYSTCKVSVNNGKDDCSRRRNVTMHQTETSSLDFFRGAYVLGICNVIKHFVLLSSLLFPALKINGALVHVYEQAEVGGVTSQFSDVVRLTGMAWATEPAPTMSGYIFTHWTISTQQDFASRDDWGRSYEAPMFMLYEDTTLTAHYLSASQDTDGDGVPDGWEIYWYGNLSQNASSDTDGDGFAFAEELENGTNPLMADVDIDGPVKYDDGTLQLYNPSNYVSVIIRSEPNGVLFETSEEWLRPGTAVDTATLSPESSSFACWRRNGVQIRDEWGRAVDSISFMMSTNAEELVAVVETDKTQRIKLYWYGDPTVSMDSDSDDDGFTFAEELANGTNPLMANVYVDGPVKYADGSLVQYNPYNYQPYLMKSEPEGILFNTVSNYVRAGWFVNSEIGDSVNDVFACWTLNGVEQREE